MSVILVSDPEAVVKTAISAQKIVVAARRSQVVVIAIGLCTSWRLPESFFFKSSSCRERSERSRERTRRSRSHHRRTPTPPTASQRLEMSAAQQAQITQFLSASLSSLGQPATTVHSIAQHVMPQPEPVRTDFSNLFNSVTVPGTSATVPNPSALAIAAAKAKDLLRARNLTDTVKVTANNGNSVASNGNESSRDGEHCRRFLVTF